MAVTHETLEEMALTEEDEEGRRMIGVRVGFLGLWD